MKALVVAFAVLLIAACQAPGSRRGDIIVDMKGVSRSDYERDLTECQQYAEEVQVGRRAAGGAAGGAAVGAVIGAVVGNSDTAKRAAGVGAVSGGAKGTARALHERHQVVRNCLSGRGYRVLN